MKSNLDSLKRVANTKSISIPRNCNRTAAKSVVVLMENQITLAQNAIDQLIEISKAGPRVQLTGLPKRIADAFFAVKVNTGNLDKFSRPIAELEKELVMVVSDVKKICGSTLDGSSEEIITDIVDGGNVTSSGRPISITSSSAGLTLTYKCVRFLFSLSPMLYNIVLRYKFG